MVCTIAKMASAAYYMESQRSYRHPNEYYVGGEEPDGVWWNPSGMFDLVDGGKVESRHFHALYEGFSPTGDRLTRNAGSPNRCAGIDMTFSPDKSVSALWAIADPELREKIEQAHYEAVRVALADVVQQYCSFTRIRNRRGVIQVVAGDLVAAMFQHGSSRANDPQLHTHCTIFNAVRSRFDSKYRALHAKPLYWWRKAAGSVYRAELADRLQKELGVRMERYGRDREFTRVAGMPEDLEARWSKRRIEMVRRAKELGLNATGANAARAEAINKMTRASKKHHDNDPERRHERWRQEAAEIVEDIEQVVSSVTGHTVEITQEELRELTEVLEKMPAQLTRDEAIFRPQDLVERTQNACAGLLGREARETSVERVRRSEEIVRLDRVEETPDAEADLEHTRVYSTRRQIMVEEDVRDMSGRMLREERFGLPEEDVQAKIDALRAEGYPLSGEQIAAIETAARAGSVAVIEGAAGSGKSTTLRPLTDLYRARGYRVIGAAVAWRTAVALGTDCDIQPYSVSRLLRKAARGQLEVDERTVVIVDEAGMLSSLQTHRILQFAERCGAKVVFVGDTQQQQAIEAGPGLRLVRDVTGGARVDEIRRQQADAEDVLRHVHGLSEETARLKADMASPAQRESWVKEYQAAQEKPEFKPWQVEASEAFRDCNADVAIAAYDSRGRFHLEDDQDATLERLVADWMRYREENPNKSTLVLARTNDEVHGLSALMRERALEGRKDDRRVDVTVCRGREENRRPCVLEIAIGDRLRIGATYWEQRLFNGTILTVEDFEGTDGRVFIRGRTEEGRKVAFWHDEIVDFFGDVRLDYGYAMTIAGAQGATVDQAFLLADALPARETIYPATTRHREGLDIYCNREGLEADIVLRRPEDQIGAVTDAQIKQYLAAAWSREGPKVAATDFMSDELIAKVRDGGDTDERTENASGASETRQPGSSGAGGQERRGQRNTAPGDRGGAAWLAANDNGNGRLREAARRMREEARDMQHRGNVAAFATGRREILKSWTALYEQVAEEGTAVAAGSYYGATLKRHAALLQVAEHYRGDPRYAALLEQRSDLGTADLIDFEKAYRAAIALRREAMRKRPAEPGYEETIHRIDGINRMLAARAKEVCRHYLPEGRREGALWVTADGDEIGLSGRDAGVWEGFNERGELTALIRYVRKFESWFEAMDEAERFLAGRYVKPVAPAIGEHFEQLKADWRAHARRARQAGKPAFYMEGYDRLHARIRKMAGRNDLPEDARRFLVRNLEIHDRLTEERKQVLDFLLEARNAVREQARRLLQIGEKLLADPAFRAHVAEIGRGRVERAVAAVRRILQAERRPAEPGTGELLERFGADWRAHLRRARQAGTAVLYIEGYDRLHARMKELAGRPDLPTEAREFLNQMLAARDRMVAERRRVLNFLAAAEGGGIDAGEMLKEGEKLLSDPDFEAHVAGIGRDRVERAVAAVRRILQAERPPAEPGTGELLERFGADWRAHLRRARQAGTAVLYIEGYDRLHARMKELAGRPDLPTEAREFLNQMLAARDRMVAERRRVLNFLAAAEGGGIDAGEMLKEGEKLLSDPDFEAHVAGIGRDRVERAVAAVRRILQAERPPAEPGTGELLERFGADWRAHLRRARQAGTAVLYIEGYDRLHARMKELAGRPDLPTEAREFLNQMLAARDRMVAERRRVLDFLAAAEGGGIDAGEMLKEGEKLLSDPDFEAHVAGIGRDRVERAVAAVQPPPRKEYITALDFVVGDRLRWTEEVRTGPWAKRTVAGTRTVEAEVVRVSVERDRGDDRIRLIVKAAEGIDAPRAGESIPRLGRQIYALGCDRAAWDDEEARQTAVEDTNVRRRSLSTARGWSR